MQENSKVFVGLDTSKMKISVAVAEEGRQGEVRFLGDIDNTPDAIRRNITKVEIGDVGQQPQRRPGQVEQPKPKCAAPDSSATTRQGIKNTS